MTATTSVRLAGGAQGFNWLPVFVAEEQGLFEQNGLAVEYLRLGSVDRATRAVKEGAADLAITPPEGVIVDFLAGGGLRILGSNSERLPMSMVARPDITTLADLRGKRIGTSSLTEGTAVYTKVLLEQVGLSADDYEFVLAGVHTTRWAALRAGEIDAAPQPAPWNLLAQREGFRLLAEVYDAIPEIVFAAVIADADWSRAHEDPVRRLLAALAQAHALVDDPANDGITVPIYQRLTTPDDRELAERGLAFTRDLGMWPLGLRVSRIALDATIDAMVRTGLAAPDRRAAAVGALDDRYLAS